MNPADLAPSERDAWKASVRRHLLETDPRRLDEARAAWAILGDLIDTHPLDETQRNGAFHRCRFALLAALAEGRSALQGMREAAAGEGWQLPEDSELSRWIVPIPGVFLPFSPQFRHGDVRR